MIIAIYSKDNTEIDIVKKYIQDNYSCTPIETTDIDWGNGSDLSKYYSFLSMNDINLDINDIKRETKIFIHELPSGNSYYKEEIIPHTITDYTDLFEQLIKDKVKEYGYDSIISACSYTNSTIDKFRLESLAFVQWRDYLWHDAVNKITAELDSGNNPSTEDFINSLRTYESFLNIGV